MKSLVLLRALRIAIAALVVVVAFFSTACGPPSPTSLTRACGVGAPPVTLINENAPGECGGNSDVPIALSGSARLLTIDVYELEERVCALVTLGRAVHDVLHAEAPAASTILSWTLLLLGGDLALLLALHIYIYTADLHSRLFFYVAYALELSLYTVLFFSYFMLNNRRDGDLSENAPRYVESSHTHMIFLLIFICSIVFLVDFLLWMLMPHVYHLRVFAHRKHATSATKREASPPPPVVSAEANDEPAKISVVCTSIYQPHESTV